VISGRSRPRAAAWSAMERRPRGAGGAITIERRGRRRRLGPAIPGGRARQRARAPSAATAAALDSRCRSCGSSARATAGAEPPARRAKGRRARRQGGRISIGTRLRRRRSAAPGPVLRRRRSGDRSGGKGGTFDLLASTDGIELNGTFTAEGGASPVVPGGGGLFRAMCDVGGGDLRSGATILVSGGSSSDSGPGAPGGAGGRIELSAWFDSTQPIPGTGGSILLGSSSALTADGGRSTGAAEGGKGGTVHLEIPEGKVSISGLVGARGGAALGSGKGGPRRLHLGHLGRQRERAGWGHPGRIGRDARRVRRRERVGRGRRRAVVPTPDTFLPEVIPVAVCWTPIRCSAAQCGRTRPEQGHGRRPGRPVRRPRRGRVLPRPERRLARAGARRRPERRRGTGGEESLRAIESMKSAMYWNSALALLLLVGCKPSSEGTDRRKGPVRREGRDDVRDHRSIRRTGTPWWRIRRTTLAADDAGVGGETLTTSRSIPPASIRACPAIRSRRSTSASRSSSRAATSTICPA
jgi:hypothetical protein